MQLVLDGEVGRGTRVQVDADGRFAVDIDVRGLADPGLSHRLQLIDTATGLASDSAHFRVQPRWTVLAEREDPIGDDHGPEGRYRYPGDPGWGERGLLDLTHARAEASGGSLRLSVRLRGLSRDWNPANGFDRMALTLHIALPGANAGARAASLDLRRAQSLHLPRLNAFARYDWNSASAPYRGDENWSLGVMATWTVFGGAGEWAEKQAAGGRAASARAGLEAARAQAELDVERADNARRVALVRLDVAERGAAQSAEAHRIVSRRYEGGLATVIELLDAAALETGSALALSHARYTGIMAEAEGRRARGQDPALVAGSLTTGIAGMIR